MFIFKSVCVLPEQRMPYQGIMNDLSPTIEYQVKIMGSEVKCSLIIRLTAISNPYPSLSA